MRRHSWIVVLSSFSWLACGGSDTPDAAGGSPRVSSPPPFSSAAPGAEALPPGHPPVDGGATAPVPGGGHPPAPDPAAPVDPKQAIAGTIDVSGELKPKATGAVALFVIARSGGQIVAVQKVEGATLPASFRISGADAMSSGGPTFAGALDITARLSKTGDAVAGPGDLEGVTRGVKVGSADVKIVLDSVRQ